ncbi:MAG: hypothetical protein PHH71_02130 [Clostridia bacterium]|nr:hypothetical protein [Clostridia bacterium]
MFDLFETIFLILIIVIGLICSFTDLKEKKIYNKILFLGFVLGVVSFLYFMLNNYNGPYLISMIVNLVISILIAYGLWLYNCWSAGDAKLFTLFSFLLPLSFYSSSNYPFFPSFNILINLFIPVIIYLLILSIINIIKTKKFDFENFSSQLVSFLKVSFVYLFLFLVFSKMFQGFLAENYLFFQILYFIFIFISIKYINQFLNKHFKLNYLFIFLVLGYCFYLSFNGEEELLKTVLGRVYIFLGIIFLFRVFINNYIDSEEAKNISIKDLKKGMVVLIDGKVERIDEERIKNLSNQDVKKYKGFPFAFFIFIAVIITILIRGSLLYLIL